jgi:DegV family protein with EDD domain
MGRVAVVTDSSACLPPELVAELGIYVVPLRFFVGDRSYLDGIDITATDIYRMLPRVSEVPSTSAPTPSDYYAAVHRASATHESIVVVTITRRFSGMYQSAMIAAKTARESLGGLQVAVIDSGTAAGAEGLVVLNAARVAAGDGNLEEVCAAAREVMERVVLVATLDTLYYLARSGRVPMAVHWANSLIHVNPIFQILPLSGDARTVRVARGRDSAVRQILELAERSAGGSDIRCVVFHSDRLKEAELLRQRVGGTLRCAELYLCDFTPAMGIHTGPGVLGLAFYRVR